LAPERTWIQLCGELVVVFRGVRVEELLPGRQGRVLFGYLVVNRLRPVPRTELAAALWPFDAPAAADSALSALLSKLRRVLGPETLAGRSTLRLELPADAFVDLEAADEAIHRAEAATARADWAAAWAPARVALHTANRAFLSGEDAPWIDEIRLHLADVRLRALEAVARSGLGLGGGETAATKRAAHALIESAPYRESGYCLLMEALASEGNVAEALLVYDRLRATLREGVGVGPSSTALMLHKRLLGEPSTA
jgi:DNA-binding SARP family transcriptional activator